MKNLALIIIVILAVLSTGALFTVKEGERAIVAMESGGVGSP